MNTCKNDEVAVLTGDIIGSSKMDPQERIALYETFPRLSAMLKECYPSDVSYRISNFRGDGWQLIVDHTGKSLEIGLFIRTYIRFMFKKRRLDTRIAIGVGAVNFIPADNVSAGDGAAYTVSGRLLETLSTSRMGIGFTSESDSLVKSGAMITVELIDHIVTFWGAGQCQAVFWALQGYNQKEIAERWLPQPIKQPSVSTSLANSGWTRVRDSLAFFEKALGNL